MEVNNEAEKIIEQAKKEAELIIQQAKQQALLIVEEAKKSEEELIRKLNDIQKKLFSDSKLRLWEIQERVKEFKKWKDHEQWIDSPKKFDDYFWYYKCEYGKYFNTEDETVRKLLYIAFMYCETLINKIIEDVYKNGKHYSMQKMIYVFDSVKRLLPYRLEHALPGSYLNEKIEDLNNFYRYEEEKYFEKEAKRMLKEEEREEKAAQKEYERELKRAQKDKEKAEEALKRAKEEAEREKENSEKFAKLQEKINSLQVALEEAMQRSERVMSMAQQTKKGWVYIISNIGSFGENVYKIGMTRRLDPMERVNELGDASVPFPFDVHAMIFSEDAPALETALHQAFEKKKTNLINTKKEFFNVTLNEIKDKVAELGYEANFEDQANAPQYRDTLYSRENF